MVKSVVIVSTSMVKKTHTRMNQILYRRTLSIQGDVVCHSLIISI